MRPCVWVITGLLVIAGAWFSWMFRYEHAGQAFFLDRWTGELVSGFDGERFDLNVRRARAPDPFSDLIPDHPGTGK